MRSVVSTSTDGGRSWSEPIDVMDQTFSRDEDYGSDVPSLAVTEDGTIYAFTQGATAAGTTLGHAGASRATGADPSGTGDAVPTSLGGRSRHPRRTGVSPRHRGRPQRQTTTTQPPSNPPPSAEAPPGPGQPGAGSRLLMSRSTDGGQTWEASVVADSGLVVRPVPDHPEATVDPETGHLYLVFEQSRERCHGHLAVEPPPPNARDNRDIGFVRSTDGGETWSDRIQLNDDDDPARNPNYDQLFPGIDVAHGGRIDIAWYDFRTDALYNPAGTGKADRSEETCWDVFSAFSSDGGATWAPNIRVSDRSMNQNEGYVLNLAYDLRGPIGGASTDEAAYIGWSDSRSGRVDLPAEDAYVASVVHAVADDRRGGRSSPCRWRWAPASASWSPAWPPWSSPGRCAGPGLATRAPPRAARPGPGP